jgi:hypothetical protein
MNVPSVEPGEIVARFILFSRHFRSSDQTIRLDAFLPPPSLALSLTRHREVTEEELWREGGRVRDLREGATLYGRADVSESAFVEQGLRIEAKPIPENPNHADALNWPTDKSEQKSKALAIANKSLFVPKNVKSGSPASS